MSNASLPPLELILRRCAEKAPDPWYPSDYAKETGNARDSLDPYLDQLRLGGLTRLTDWVAGRGQGYALTPAGQEILKNPRQLARLLAGKWSPPVARESRPTAIASSPWERGEAVRQALLYPVQPMLTFILISISVCIFLVQFVSKDQYEQIRDLTVVTPLGLLQHQWWRLLTTTFVHGSPLHLAFNMYALYALGQGAERIWGRGRFLAIYIIAAIGGTCLAMAIQPFPCVGASGAICGIFAGEAAWVFYNRGHLDPRVFSAWNRNFLINVVLIAFISFFPGVSWGAHLGGAIAGLLIALWLNYFQFQPGWRRWLQWLGIIIIPLVSVGLLVRTMQTGSQWLTIRRGAEKEESKTRINTEAREFEEKYLPQIQSAFRQAARKVEEMRLDDILAQNPTRRDGKEVEKAITGLSSVTGSLESAAEELRQAGPYSTRLVEEARKVGLKDLETRIAYWQLAKGCLEKRNNWTKKDEAKLQQQKEEMEKADQEWRALLR